jgi:hypothetical protein
MIARQSWAVTWPACFPASQRRQLRTLTWSRRCWAETASSYLRLRWDAAYLRISLGFKGGKGGMFWAMGAMHEPHEVQRAWGQCMNPMKSKGHGGNA